MQMLGERKIDMGHARALLTLDPEQQYQVALNIVDKHLNVREAEDLANSMKFQHDRANDGVTNNGHEKCEDWSQDLSSKLLTKVSVKLTKQGKGKVTIHVTSVDEVENLIRLL
jgi:ParB family chromosome partitioning protein